MTQDLIQNRIKAFEIPHRGLRNLLSQLNMLAGNTDFSNKEQVEQLHRIGSDLFRLLTEHANDEEEITLRALEQRCPGASLQNSSEHEMIGQQQSRLEKLFRLLIQRARQGEGVQEPAEQFYFEFNHFHSAYLLHMLEEEEETQRLLWKYFSDAELLDMRRLIISRISPESMKLWYRYSAPAMNPQSLLQWISGVKAGAPQPVFEQLVGTLQEILPKDSFERLVAELN